MRNDNEVQSMIAKLEESKKNIRQFNFFGDNNWAAIDAATETLQDNLSVDDVYDQFDDHNSQMLAINAIDWRNGDISDEELLDE